MTESLKGCSRVPVEGFDTVFGKGISGTVDGVRYYVGNEKLLSEFFPAGAPSATSPAVLSCLDEWLAKGYTITLLFSEEKVYAVLAITDGIKERSISAIKTLRDSGIEVHMLTGDNETAAATVADLALRRIARRQSPVYQGFAGVRQARRHGGRRYQ